MDSNNNNSCSILEKTLRDGKLFRQAANAVASATMTPLNAEAPQNRLTELVAKGLAVEKDEILRGVPSNSLYDTSTLIPATATAAYGSIPAPRAAAVVDFRQCISAKTLALIVSLLLLYKTQKARRRVFLSMRHGIFLSTRCARFSPDGRFIATGSADTSIKLFEPINDLDFHPQNTVLISGGKDHTIKFFDFSKATAKRAFRVIQDTHNVRSVSFHPSGDFLLAGCNGSSVLILYLILILICNGIWPLTRLIWKNNTGTDHPIAHLYDVNTFQCYLSANVPEISVNGAINQVRYSSTGGMYVTASKDGAIRLWDGVSANCVRSIVGAHGTAEATSANFTKDQRFVLSCGKDSTVKLWEVSSGRLVKQYLGATHTQLRFQAVFNDTEEFVLSIDEPSNELKRWQSGRRIILAHLVGLSILQQRLPSLPVGLTGQSGSGKRFCRDMEELWNGLLNSKHLMCLSDEDSKAIEN
ncbi:cleavage stimulation factor subunit 50 [Citrus sinensis]|nr:cleavage stimulation factor subunit 50 [Citrus sinensis]